MSEPVAPFTNILRFSRRRGAAGGVGADRAAPSRRAGAVVLEPDPLDPQLPLRLHRTSGEGAPQSDVLPRSPELTCEVVFTLVTRGRVFLTSASKFNTEPNGEIFDVSPKNSSMELAVI